MLATCPRYAGLTSQGRMLVPCLARWTACMCSAEAPQRSAAWDRLMSAAQDCGASGNVLHLRPLNPCLDRQGQGSAHQCVCRRGSRVSSCARAIRMTVLPHSTCRMFHPEPLHGQAGAGQRTWCVCRRGREVSGCARAIRMTAMPSWKWRRLRARTSTVSAVRAGQGRVCWVCLPVPPAGRWQSPLHDSSTRRGGIPRGKISRAAHARPSPEVQVRLPRAGRSWVENGDRGPTAGQCDPWTNARIAGGCAG